MSAADVDADLQRSWHAITIGVAAVQRRLDAELESAGISAQFFAVLQRLLEADGYRLPMSSLARDVAMTSGGFTKLADRMAREGLIDRRGSSLDRRVVHASLTEAGLQLARRAAGVYRAALRIQLGHTVDPATLTRTAAVVQKLHAAAGLDRLPVDESPEVDGERPVGQPRELRRRRTDIR